MTKTARISIPDRSSPGLPRTAPSVAHQDRCRKYATDVKRSKIRARNNTIIGTWNVRTLRAAGKVEELTHEMSRYHWHILGLCEVRWKNMGETTTQEDHKLYYSGKQDKHEHGVGFLVHKDTLYLHLGFFTSFTYICFPPLPLPIYFIYLFIYLFILLY